MKKIGFGLITIFLVFSTWAQVPFKAPKALVLANSELAITPLSNHTWAVETADMTTMYILEGTNRAMLIDTGTKCTALDSIVRKITTKPLDVVITHVHPDHAGNIRYFDKIYIHPADTLLMPNYNYKGKVEYINDGDTFDLGGRTIEVAHMPGHTPGSIVLLEKEKGDCYSGDAFGSGQVWLQLLPHVPMATYLDSCRKMEKIMEKDNIERIYCGHYPYLKTFLTKEYIQTMERLATRLVNGDQKGSKPYYGKTLSQKGGRQASLSEGYAMIVYNPDNIN